MRHHITISHTLNTYDSVYIKLDYYIHITRNKRSFGHYPSEKRIQQLMTALARHGCAPNASAHHNSLWIDYNVE